MNEQLESASLRGPTLITILLDLLCSEAQIGILSELVLGGFLFPMLAQGQRHAAAF